MKQNFILGSDFCQQFSVVIDFSTMNLSLTVGTSDLAVQLLKEELAMELNEVKELCSKNLENFCQPVSVKQFRKLLRKHKAPATVVVVRNKACKDTAKVQLSQMNTFSQQNVVSKNLSTPSISTSVKQVFRDFLEVNGNKVDQFVINDFYTLQQEWYSPQSSVLVNKLFLDSDKGREAFAKSYQRTQFQLEAIGAQGN